MKRTSIYYGKYTLSDMKLTNMLNKWISQCFCTTNLPKHSPEIQLILTCVFVLYITSSITTWHHFYCNMSCTNCAFTLLTMLCMAKRVKVVCIANKSKPVHWLQVINTMTAKVEWWWWMYCINGLDDDRHPMMMSTYMKIIYFCILMISGGFANFVD